MTIKAAGGVFGRNPTFNDVTVEGDLSVDGTLTIGGSVITGLNLQGNWDAATNTPDLTVLTPPAGQFWIVSVAGSTNLGGITNWTVGDWALYDGTGWQRVEGGTVDLSNGVTGTLAITNGGTGASTASTARTNLGSGTVGDNLFTATTALAAQQAMDTEVGVDVQPYDATILKSADIGVSVQGYDADTAKYDDVTANFTGTLQNGGSNVLVDTDIGSTVEAYDSTILKSADIGSSVQAYDADTAKYDDTTANFTGTLQNSGSNVLVDTDIGSTVEAYDATILKSADIGSTVQGYDADTAKYDDATANFTGTLQNGGSNVVVDSDIGSTVQAYDADTAKLDAAQTWTATQTFNDIAVDGVYFGATSDEYLSTYERGSWTPDVRDSSGNSVASYGLLNGRYIRVGSLVTIFGMFNSPNLTGLTSSDDVRIYGIPFQASNFSGDRMQFTGTCRLENVSWAVDAQIHTELTRSYTFLRISESRNGTTDDYLTVSEFTGTSDLWFQITYPTTTF